MTDITQSNPKRGAPLGNQNARIHGFYSNRLTRKQQRALEAASYLRGFDQEIAIVRMKIEDILTSSPENYPALMLAITALVKLVKAKNMLWGEGDAPLPRSMTFGMPGFSTHEDNLLSCARLLKKEGVNNVRGEP
jgi:hypothetical protein